MDLLDDQEVSEYFATVTDEQLLAALAGAGYRFYWIKEVENGRISQAG